MFRAASLTRAFCGRLTGIGLTVLALLPAGCVRVVPVEGKPCPLGDIECDDGDNSTPFYCSLQSPRVCLAGAALEPAANLPPIVQAAAIVAPDGTRVTGAFSAVDPDSTAKVTFRVGASSPGNGHLELKPNGTYTFDADRTSDGPAMERFQIVATDTFGAETTVTAFAVVIQSDDVSLMTWTGEKSSNFSAEENWSPLASPGASRSAYLPQVDGFAPALLDTAAVRNLYVGSHQSFDLGGLEVFGDEVFGASSSGRGPLLLYGTPNVGGELPGLSFIAGGAIFAPVHVTGDIRLLPGSSTVELRDGASVLIDGRLLQDDNAAGIEFFSDAAEDASTMTVRDDARLLGGATRLNNGKLFFGGDLELGAGGIQGSSSARLVFQGKGEQRVAAPMQPALPPTRTLAGTTVRFTQGATITNAFDVGGRLFIDAGEEIIVVGELTLRATFTNDASVDGQLVAETCVISPEVTKPSWVNCGVTVDGGVPVLDAGSPRTDAGFDAGSGVFDSGVSDAGVLDGGAFDGGAFDGGVFDSGAFDGGVFDSGTLDGGVFDSGVFDSGAFDADAGGPNDEDDGGIDVLSLDAGAFGPGCVATELRDGRVRNGLIVVKAGAVATMALVIEDAADDGGLGLQSMGADFGSSTIETDGSWTFDADADAVGYFDVPIAYSRADGSEANDCLRVRVVNPELEYNVIMPASAADPALVDWNLAEAWEPPVTPDETTIVFFPQAFQAPLVEISFRREIRSLLVETGASVHFDEERFFSFGLGLRVHEEIAFGTGTTFVDGVCLKVGPVDATVTSAVVLEELECANNAVRVVGPVQAKLLNVPASCSFDIGDQTLWVDGPVVASSLSSPAIEMNSPASRFIVAGNFQLDLIDETGLNDGVLEAKQDVQIYLVTPTSEATAFNHHLRMTGTEIQALKSNGGFAHIDFMSPTTMMNVDGFSAQSVDFGVTSLCVGTSVGPEPHVETAMISAGFAVTGGSGWNVQECTEETNGDCASLRAGLPDVACN